MKNEKISDKNISSYYINEFILQTCSALQLNVLS